MLKIATHDAASAEKPANIISWLSIPFSRTQSKTIKEQYDAGCRCFDIRVRKYRGKWHCAHGLFVTKRTAEDIISEINSFPEKCQIDLTYEGGMNNNESFKLYAVWLRSVYSHIIWGGAAVKYGEDAKGIKVKYTYLLGAEPEYIGGVQGFAPLDGRDLKILLPIPWLWNKLCTPHHQFGVDIFTYVDFL